MYIADHPISKPYWEPFLKHIILQFKKNKYHHVVEDVYLMWWREARMYVIAPLDESGVHNIIGWFFLQQRKEWKAWEVMQSYIFTAFRGQGWSKALYNTVINVEGLILASGPQQTRLARQMWKNMVAKDQFTIWAHDFKNLNSWSPVTYDPENDELWCQLPIYDEQWNYYSARRDIRLIAIRKQHDNRLRCSSRFP